MLDITREMERLTGSFRSGALSWVKYMERVEVLLTRKHSWESSIMGPNNEIKNVMLISKLGRR